MNFQMIELSSTPEERSARYAKGRRVTVASVVLNIVLSGFKITAGIIGRSQAIIADGVHSLSDLGSDIVVLVGLRISVKPSDETHHYGHAKSESLATLAVGGLLIAAGVFISYESFVGITEHGHRAPDWLPIIAAAVSIVVKEGLYQWTWAVGKEIESSSLVANAWHHRTDALTSVAIVVGLSVARAYPTLAILDHLIAVVVAVFVVRIALIMICSDVQELMDSAPSKETMERVCNLILSVEGVCGLHKCRARRVQGRIFVDVHVQVPGDLTVAQGHQISRVLRDKVKEIVEGVAEVLVHIEPAKHNYKT